MIEATDKQLTELIIRWSRDPERFVREAMNVETVTDQQKKAFDILKRYVGAKLKIRDKQKLTEDEERISKKTGISIMAGRGVGKDAFAAWCICWFLFCFPRALVPCTAPSAHQLRDVLWKEVYKWLSKSKIKDYLTWQSEKIFWTPRRGKDWFAVGRTANPKASADEQAGTLSGFHDEYMMVVVDEASEIADAVFVPLEGTLTQTLNFMLVLFNPARSQGFAIETQRKNRDHWECLQWNAEESEIVTKESIQSKAEKYGRDSNYYRVNVLGIPPKQDQDTLIPWDWVMDAVDREIIPMTEDPLVFGIDIGAGGDKSILLPRTGNTVHKLRENDSPDQAVLEGWLLRQIFDEDPELLVLDCIGLGWGIVGSLRKDVRCRVIGVNVSEAATQDGRFHRLRDELWWRLRERFEKRDISIPRDDELIGELTSIKYEEPGGKIKVEGKKELKRRGIKSPNKADALCLTEYYATDTLRKLRRIKESRRRQPTGLSWRTV